MNWNGQRWHVKDEDIWTWLRPFDNSYEQVDEINETNKLVSGSGERCLIGAEYSERRLK